MGLKDLREVGIRMVQIELNDDGAADVSYFFSDDGKRNSKEPWSLREFIPGSPTRAIAEQFEERLEGKHK